MQQLGQRLPRRRQRTGKRIRLWLGRHQRGLRFVAMGIAVLAVLVTVAQVAYPSGRLLPFVAVQGQRVGGASVADAAVQLTQKYADAAVTVKTDTKSFTGSFDETGITVDAARSAQDAARYPLWQRLIPFSSVGIAFVRDTPMQAQFDAGRLRAFAGKVQDEGRTAAVNASLTAKGGRVKLVPSTPSKEYPVGRVVSAVKQAGIAPHTEVTVAPLTKPAALTDEEAQAMAKEVQELVDARLILVLQDEEIRVDKKDLGGWLVFAANQDADGLEISLNTDGVQKYLESIQTKVYKAPGTTRIQLIDDREVGRTPGAAGRGIAMDKAVAVIQDAVKRPGDDRKGLEVGALPPEIAYDKKYSNSDAELASLLSRIASAKGSYGISLMELGGRSAYAGGDKQFVAASTYKLYVAYAVFKEVEAGRLSWSDTISGRSAAACFDDMIIVSDNDCPRAFGTRIGWARITDMMHDLGLSNSTRLGAAMYTTPNDLAYFLYRVQNDSLLSRADKERLIGAMKRQSYTRAGIPAGAGGTVADKVGEVDGYYHDAAIVYGSKKTYVLVVMTYGGSFPGIADVAGQIHAYVNK